MDTPLTIYLSGPMCGVADEIRDSWRDEVISKYGNKCIFLDPRVRKLTETNKKWVVKKDKEDILRSDVLLVRYFMPTVGTSMEILFAHNLNIPVLCVINEETFKPLWLEVHVTKFFNSFEDAIKYANEKY